ncbi:nucleotidyltransferase domain-containing protein [Streptomyces sp. NPDC003233]
MVMEDRLRQAKLEIGRRVAHEVLEEEGTLGVYLGGSLAAGLGTTRSDVDVVVVVDDGAPHQDRRLVRDGSRVDIAVRPARLLRESVAEVARRCRDRGRPFAISDEVEQLVRLLYAEVYSETVPAKTIRQQLEEIREPLREALVGALVRRAASRYEDLLGFVEIRDGDSAAMLSAELLLRAVHTFLVSSGDLYLEAKWVWQRLRRCAALPADELRALYFADAADPGLVARRISAAGTVFAAVVRNAEEGTPGRWRGARLPDGPGDHPGCSVLDTLVTDGVLRCL